MTKQRGKIDKAATKIKSLRRQRALIERRLKAALCTLREERLRVDRERQNQRWREGFSLAKAALIRCPQVWKLGHHIPAYTSAAKKVGAKPTAVYQAISGARKSTREFLIGVKYARMMEHVAAKGDAAIKISRRRQERLVEARRRGRLSEQQYRVAEAALLIQFSDGLGFVPDEWKAKEWEFSPTRYS